MNRRGAALPGGINSIPDIAQRRAAGRAMAAAAGAPQLPVTNEDRTVPGPAGDAL